MGTVLLQTAFKTVFCCRFFVFTKIRNSNKIAVKFSLNFSNTYFLFSDQRVGFVRAVLLRTADLKSILDLLLAYTTECGECHHFKEQIFFTNHLV